MSSFTKIALGFVLGWMLSAGEYWPVVVSLVLWVACEYGEVRLKQIEADREEGKPE